MMKRMSLGLSALLAFALMCGIPGGPSSAWTTTAHAMAAADQETQDILHMRDGRVLTGEIKEEVGDRIVFRYIDRTLNIATTLEFDRSEVLQIERDVAINTGAGDQRAEPREPRRPDRDREDDQSRTRGLAEGASDDEDLISFYVIPMKGQMGTDIHPSVYRDVVEVIKREKPDIIVWKLECSHVDDLLISFADPTEQGMVHLIEDYRNLVTMLHRELADFRQIMWVQDSVGVSSLIAMAIPEMYMAPDARLVGLQQIFSMAAGWQDEDVRAKMVAAWVSIANAFVIRGGHSSALGEAMIRPDRLLSATWRGREVNWSLSAQGQIIVNNSRQRTANFNAKMAEDFMISNGTAETLDDLALLLGYREYRVHEGEALKVVQDHVEGWRRAFDQTMDLFEDYARYMRYSGQDDPIRYLSRARANIRQVISLIRRYPALENRLLAFYGIQRIMLEVLEAEITEDLRALQRGGGRGGGGGGGRGGGGGFRGR